MAKDPAFLFYPGDYLGGTIGMTFEEKGAYVDLLILQFNKGAFTEEQAKRLLNGNFSKLWAALKEKFREKDSKFYNARLEVEKSKRSGYTQSRRKNLKKEEETPPHMGLHMDAHMENENKDLIKIEKVKEGAETIRDYKHADQLPPQNDFETYEQWTDLILNQQDQYFPSMLKKEGIEFSKDAIKNHLSLVARYSWKFDSQQKFRISLVGEMRKYLQKPTGGFQKQETSLVYNRPPTNPPEESILPSPEKQDAAYQRMINEDIETLTEHPEFIPKIAALKLDWLRTKKMVVIEEEERKNYYEEAQTIFIQDIMDHMELIPNRSLMDYYRANKSFRTEEQDKIKVIAKELAYMNYLKQTIPQTATP